jgi:hypothetical protein
MRDLKVKERYHNLASDFRTIVRFGFSLQSPASRDKTNVPLDQSTRREICEAVSPDRDSSLPILSCSVAPARALRTRQQCKKRWHDKLNSSIDPTTARAGKWTADEDKKLRDAVRRHGGKDWDRIATLVPGRTKNQCRSRWHDALVCNIDPTTARAGKLEDDEDRILKNAVPAQGRKNWKEIAALVPGRTQKQCSNRWHDALDPSISRANGRAGKWEEDEDKMLMEAVQTHGGKNWEEIAALVRGRTKKQCFQRWHLYMVRQRSRLYYSVDIYPVTLLLSLVKHDSSSKQRSNFYDKG